MVTSLSGCAPEPYSHFYSGRVDAAKDPKVIIPNEEPKLFRGSDKEKDALAMAENGYVMVGYSAFNAGNVDNKGAIAQAKKVHASIILIYSEYVNTVSGVMPFTQPDTRTSTSSLSGNVYGPRGDMATYSGTATTTTYGSKTTYIPFSVNRYDYLATYWAKLKPLLLGVRVRDLTPETRNEIQSNKGVRVAIVVKDSPAFRSDILKGDVLRRIGETEIYDAKSFGNTVQKYEGQNVFITIYRNGKLLKKQVQINKGS